MDVDDIRNSLKSLMWRNMGVRREAEGLQDAIDSIDHWSRYVLGIQFSDPTGWELQNMLCVAADGAAALAGRNRAAAMCGWIFPTGTTPRGIATSSSAGEGMSILRSKTPYFFAWATLRKGHIPGTNRPSGTTPTFPLAILPCPSPVIHMLSY